MNLHHIGIACRSSSAGDRFYRDLLGLEKKRERTVPGEMIKKIFDIDQDALIIEYGNETMLLEVFVIPELEEDHPVSHLCLEVNNRVAFMEKCAAMGFGARQIPKTDGTAIVFVKDDDGNQYEIKEQP
ncbi:VOC family protein [Desulfosudis oleivorans]|uniref:Glyoxalase/bleomycin resistance protein/dioxygenase n=1 Tax=Desulfosudis oleivorans (strain DSM 6200 / JCM 39069 / Hxd3) TaxID=96561 RepID=A8ZSG3_DESOH|nr:VOC family protein [Desulfosudis oleivorans]ABW67700.1 Glyoxalase/bleomycin resistance protein/dioxygenase [Desulfosudis oleivorans Hxd3]